MSPRHILHIALVLGLFFVQPWASSAYSVTYEPGLNPGNSAVYSVTGSYSESVVNTTMRVLKLEGSRVTVEFEDRYATGETQPTDQFWVDVITGENGTIGEIGEANFIFSISKGLSPRDQVFTLSEERILRDSMLECGSRLRTANYAEFQKGSQTRHYYWDRDTGVMCSFNLTDSGGDLTLLMLSTSLWTPGNPPDNPGEGDLVLLVPLVATVTLVAFSLVYRRKRKRKLRLSR